MMSSKTTKKIFAVITIIAFIALIAGSILPYLIYG